MSQLGGIALGAVLSQSGGIAGAAIHGMLDPYKRQIAWGWNAIGPTIALDPPAIIAAYYAGRFGPPESDGAILIRDTLLLDHGIEAEGSKAVALTSPQMLPIRKAAWRSWIDLAQPLPPFDRVRDAWLRNYGPGLVSDGTMSAILSRMGLTDPGIQQVMSEMGDALSTGTVINLYLLGFFGQGPDAFQTYLTLMRAAGVTDYDTANAMLADGRMIGLGDAMSLRMRQRIDDNRLTQILAQVGIRDQQSITEQFSLLQQLPGIGDVVRSSIQQAFDGQLAAFLDLDSEIPPELTYWLSQYGLNWSESAGPNGAVPWPLLLWRAGRTLPGIGELIDMRNRLRPGRSAYYADPAYPVVDVTDDDLAGVLMARGMPGKWRNRVIAASRPRLQQRYLSSVVSLFPDQTDWLKEQYRDQGFNEDQTSFMVNVQIAKKEEKDNAWKRQFTDGVRRRTISCIEKAAEIGLLTVGEARQRLIALGLDSGSVESGLATVDLCLRTKVLQETIRVTRNAFLRGELTADEVTARLQIAGVNDAQIAYYILLWQVQFTPRRKELSTNQILSLVAAGQLDPITAEQRLLNLGWNEPDAVLELAKAEATLLAHQEMAKTKAANARAKAIRALQRQAEQLQATARKQEPLSALKGFYKKGEITAGDLASRMTTQGYPQEFIDWTIQSITPKIPVGA